MNTCLNFSQLISICSMHLIQVLKKHSAFTLDPCEVIVNTRVFQIASMISLGKSISYCNYLFLLPKVSGCYNSRLNTYRN